MLKYSVFTKNLYSESGRLLKSLDCPYDKRWEALSPISASSRRCEMCSKSVTNTKSLSTQEIERLLEQSPNACIAVSSDQQNIQILSPIDALLLGEDLCEQ